jgi:hypothetical protein
MHNRSSFSAGRPGGGGSFSSSSAASSTSWSDIASQPQRCSAGAAAPHSSVSHAQRPALRRLAIAMGETPQAPCYVILFQAPRSVHACFLRGGYRDISGDADAIAAVFAGRVVRAGSYGDPAAVPAWVWIAVYRNAAGRTGYTHQWNHPIAAVRENAAALRGHVMASVETDAEYKVAKLHDWRTFRVRETADSAVFPNERVCPASKEAGFKTTCEACQACSGMLGRGHSDIVIAAH